MSNPFPWHLLVFFEILHLSISYPTSKNHLRKWFFAPSMIAIALYMLTQTPVLANNVTAYTVGSNLGFRICFTVYVVYTQPDFPNFWRRTQDGDQLPTTFGTKQKISWMIDLAYGARRVGWIQEPTAALPPRPKSSSQFVVSRIFYIAVYMFWMVLATSFQIGNPAFDREVHPSTDGVEAYIRGQPPLWRILSVASWVITAISGLHLSHIPVAVISVSMGLSAPEEWPPMIGSFSDAFTLRQFWGKVWHQTMRPMISGIGKKIANDLFKFTRGSNLSAYTQLYIGFLLSGLIHLSSDYMVRRRLTSSTVRFFMLQAVAITLEDLFLWYTKALRSNPGVGWLNRIVGYCWVIWWMTWSFPIFLDPMSVDGYTIGGAVFRPVADLLLATIAITF